MSKKSTARDAFKFSLQEEKINTMRRLANAKLKGAENNLDDDDNDNEARDKKSVTSYNDNSEHLDHNNIYLKSMIEKFKLEIETLKSYITRLNREIRKNLNMDIPGLNDLDILNLHSNINSNEHNSIDDTFVKFYNDSINRLLNPEYLNPIFSIYDNHIFNIENELKHYKQLCTKYETKITELSKENNSIRETVAIKCNELKDLLKIKNESDPNSNSNTILDLEFISALENRNNILSKENEILAINYQKVSKELFEFSMIYGEKHKESVEKIQLYDNLQHEYTKLTNILDSTIVKNQINENKIYELTELIAKNEIDKENLKLECNKFRSEISNLAEANNFYKNFINKINSV
jgi:hypothetical protein